MKEGAGRNSLCRFFKQLLHRSGRNRITWDCYQSLQQTKPILIPCLWNHIVQQNNMAEFGCLVNQAEFSPLNPPTQRLCLAGLDVVAATRQRADIQKLAHFGPPFVLTFVGTIAHKSIILFFRWVKQGEMFVFCHRYMFRPK